jgi:hypothetical protein
MNRNVQEFNNKATKIATSILGITLAFAAFHHGFFEFLQGNKATDGILIQAIGEQQRYWVHGTEEAITIIPNYLVTGLLAMAISIFAIIWSVKFIDRKHGSIVFLLTFIALTLVGGGLGHIVFFLPVFGYSTRIHKKLIFWSKCFPKNVRRVIGNIWPFSVGIASVAFIIALEISIFGFFPGVEDPDEIFTICWSFLGLSLIMIQVSYISGFASDIENRQIAVD